LRIELGARQEGEQHGTSAREKFDPGLISAERRGTQRGTDDKLRDSADNNLGHRGRHAQPDR